ncbi:MAG: peptidoglycan editing factor PgeF [Corynebacterium sp.]|nr:peptidoglycan editing factor PgeF [Corynebacterium sp.]
MKPQQVSGRAGVVHAVFTNKRGGVSTGRFASLNLGDHVGDDPAAVAKNRELLQQEVGAPPIIWMDQVHSATVRVVDANTPVPVRETDAIVTNRKGVAVAVLVADCVPVLLADPHVGIVAAVHAGRQGARNGIVPAALKAMEKLGARIDQVVAFLGPAASGSKYEVPADMAADVESHLPGCAATTQWGTTGVDVRAGLHRQLLFAGVASVDVSEACTITDTEYFSYRRENVTGRQAGLMWISEKE